MDEYTLEDEVVGEDRHIFISRAANDDKWTAAIKTWDGDYCRTDLEAIGDSIAQAISALREALAVDRAERISGSLFPR